MEYLYALILCGFWRFMALCGGIYEISCFVD